MSERKLRPYRFSVYGFRAHLAYVLALILRDCELFALYIANLRTNNRQSTTPTMSRPAVTVISPKGESSKETIAVPNVFKVSYCAL